MIKALFKKQMLELNVWLFQDKKTKIKRKIGSMMLWLVLWAFVFVSLGSMVFYFGRALCAPLVQANLEWLYFALMGMVTLVLSVFGSVFNTYSTLYLAKDNDMLLAMPIPSYLILLVRLFGIWFWGLIYGAVVFIPAMLVYIIYASPSVLSVLLSFFMFILLSLFSLVLSCIVGWVVAKISIRVKNKSAVIVTLSLLLVGVYYYLYYKAYVLLGELLRYATVVGDKIQRFLKPIYWFGTGCEGNVMSFVLFSIVVIVLFAVTYYVLSKSFLKIAISGKNVAKKKSKRVTVRSKSVGNTLLFKELKRFIASPTYMLNCGFGVIILLAVSVISFIKGPDLFGVLLGFVTSDKVQLLLIAMICVCAATVDISAPSVSLEGKNIWLIHSLPVSAWSVLKAKLLLHLIIAQVPTLICSICMIIVFKLEVFIAVAMLILPFIFNVFSAVFGLTMDLIFAKLDWKNEIVPIKQSFSVFFSLFGGIVIVAALGILYYFIHNYITVKLFLVLVFLCVALLDLTLLYWVYKRGTKRFMKLH